MKDDFLTHSQDIVAIVPGRGGSKGVTRKNVHKIAGIPLIAISVVQALLTDEIGMVVITTEDEEIEACAKQYAKVLDPLARRWMIHRREESLSQDFVQLDDVVLDVSRRFQNSSTFVLLQPTSPFREKGEISRAIYQFNKKRSHTLVSGYILKSQPSGFLWGESDGEIIPFGHTPSKRLGRQWMRRYNSLFKEDGSMYIFDADHVNIHRSFRTDIAQPFIRQSANSIDVDTPKDLDAAIRYGELFFRHNPLVTMEQWAEANKQTIQLWVEKNPGARDVFREFLS